MTKWERIFRSWHSTAAIDKQSSGRGPMRRTVWWVHWAGRNSEAIGEGISASRAWKAACDALRLDKERGTTR
jgi:hypothetical protein